MSKKQNNATNAARVDKPVITVKVTAGSRQATIAEEKTPPEKTTTAKVAKRQVGTTKSNAPVRDTSPAQSTASATKIDTVISMLRAKGGTSIEQVIKATGWQPHSVRGAISGQLKKKLGLNILSEKVEGTRLYRIAK